MATRLEPNLRVVKSSHGKSKDPGGNARSTAESQRDEAAPTATAAPGTPALAQEAVGEILNGSNLGGDAHKHATLIGTGAFPATPAKHAIDRKQLFVAPSTVTAISRAGKTRYPTEPSVKVELGPT